MAERWVNGFAQRVIFENFSANINRITK